MWVEEQRARESRTRENYQEEQTIFNQLAALLQVDKVTVPIIKSHLSLRKDALQRKAQNMQGNKHELAMKLLALMKEEAITQENNNGPRELRKQQQQLSEQPHLQWGEVKDDDEQQNGETLPSTKTLLNNKLMFFAPTAIPASISNLRVPWPEQCLVCSIAIGCCCFDLTLSLVLCGKKDLAVNH